jgi:hypothetical protein
VAVEISFPFRVDGSGGIAIETDGNLLARDHVRAVIGTLPGERVMRPTFGIDVRSFLFTDMPAASQAELEDRLTTQLQANVPEVTFQGTTVDPSDDPYTVNLAVSYDVRSSNPNSISQTVQAVVSQ